MPWYKKISFKKNFSIKIYGTFYGTAVDLDTITTIPMGTQTKFYSIIFAAVLF